MLAARHKLSRKLCANLVEAVVEAHSRPNQEASFRNALLRGARLSKLHANQQKTLRAVVLKLPASFWPAAAFQVPELALRVLYQAVLLLPVFLVARKNSIST